MNETMRAVAEPVAGVSWTEVVPHVGGVPLTEEKARELYLFLTGQRLLDWRELAVRYPMDAAAHLRTADEADDRMRGAAIALLCAVKLMLGDAAPGLELRTLDGRISDPATMRWDGLHYGMQGATEWAPIPPVLGS